MSRPPPSFDPRSYVAWHEGEVPADAPLFDKLTNLRNELISEAPTRFEQLGQLLTHTARFSRTEARLRTKLLPSAYIVPTEELKAPSSAPTTFKSVTSIVDKLWRKNRSGPNVTLVNIRSEITDLVRVSVIAPTQFHVGIFGDRLRLWDELISDSERKSYLAGILSVRVDAEAKLASGYFAHHALVTFDDGYVVEVQVHSTLAAAWRELSHHAYERARLGLDEGASFGGPSTRLVSLGHLLHLAECELERIAFEFK